MANSEQPNFQEVLQAFWANHPLDELWSIETQRVDQQTVKATIRRGDRLIVTAHYTSGDRLAFLEEQAILRAINLLPKV